jgi:ABC-2 type transport system ATP-binding protein
LIEVEHLTKHFGNHAAVSDVSFRAERGEILGFLGPNGAGKTTTMRVLTCFLPPTSGEARIAGFNVQRESIEVRRRIGYLPENVPLYADLRVSTFLDFVGRLKGMSKGDRRARIARVMDECGITQVENRTIGKLSKGFRQRVGLAQALLNDPEVLILDEPTVGLDPRQIVEIRELIRNLAGERTIILSTHILPEVSLLCQRVLIINKGHLISADTPDNLKRRIRSSMVVEVTVRGDKTAVSGLLEALPDVGRVQPLEDPGDSVCRLRVEAKNARDIREAVARTVVEAGFGLLSQSTVDLSLEDIFVHLVTQEDI